MSQPQTVTVQILDKDYPISCPPQQRTDLENAARYVDGKMREIRNSGKVIGAERIAVLAALNIAHELLQRGATPGQPAADTRERMRELLAKVERALQESPDEQR
jgi:cell division protein ZapA